MSQLKLNFKIRSDENENVENVQDRETGKHVLRSLRFGEKRPPAIVVHTLLMIYTYDCMHFYYIQYILSHEFSVVILVFLLFVTRRCVQPPRKALDKSSTMRRSFEWSVHLHRQSGSDQDNDDSLLLDDLTFQPFEGCLPNLAHTTKVAC